MLKLDPAQKTAPARPKRRPRPSRRPSSDAGPSACPRTRPQTRPANSRGSLNARSCQAPKCLTGLQSAAPAPIALPAATRPIAPIRPRLHPCLCRRSFPRPGKRARIPFQALDNIGSFDVTAPVTAHFGAATGERLTAVPSGATGEDHEVLRSGTKGLPRNTRCRASRALSPFLRPGGDVAAEGAGDLLAQLHRPQIAFRLVVVEGNREAAQEDQDAVGVVADAVEQIARLALLAAAPPFRALCRSDRIVRITRLHGTFVGLEEPLFL